VTRWFQYRRKASGLPRKEVKKGVFPMIAWALIFLAVAIAAGILGFGGIIGAQAWIAQVLFILFLVFFLVSLLSGRKPPVT